MAASGWLASSFLCLSNTESLLCAFYCGDTAVTKTEATAFLVAVCTCVEVAGVDAQHVESGLAKICLKGRGARGLSKATC